MADSTRLQELSDAGVSVWIDSLSREMLHSGQLAALMADDSVVGVTSNPTIFQKALAEGDLYDEQLREVAATTDDAVEIFFALAMDDIRDACDLMRPVWERTGRGRRLGLARGRPDARLRARAHLRAGRPLQQGGRPAEPLRQDPGHRARARRDRGLHRQGRLDQRDADLLARALRRRRRGVPPRPRAPRRRRRRPAQGALGRELLRLPRRHRGRQAARGGRPQRPAGKARGREREARLPALPRRLRRRPLGLPRRQGRAAAALPVGVDLGQEPRLPRRDLRRGADRPGHRQHDAARDGAGRSRITAR